MSLNPNALTTLARTKIFLGITNTTSDAKLELLINSVSAYIEKYTGRKFARATYTNEVYDGSSNSYLYLRNTPILTSDPISLSQRLSPQNEDDWEAIEASDYFVDNAGRISLIGHDSFSTGFTDHFSGGIQNFRATYTGGYILPSSEEFGDDPEMDLPADLEQAVWEMVQAAFNQSTHQGIERSKVRDIEVTYAKTMNADIYLKQAINQYRRRVYG